MKIDEVHAADWMIECCKLNMKRQLGLSVALNSMEWILQMDVEIRSFDEIRGSECDVLMREKVVA